MPGSVPIRPMLAELRHRLDSQRFAWVLAVRPRLATDFADAAVMTTDDGELKRLAWIESRIYDPRMTPCRLARSGSRVVTG